MKKRTSKSKSRLTVKKPNKVAAKKLVTDYRKYFVAPKTNPDPFEIFTAYDYSTPTELTNHS